MSFYVKILNPIADNKFEYNHDDEYLAFDVSNLEFIIMEPGILNQLSKTQWRKMRTKAPYQTCMVNYINLKYKI
jgi:hypothetical protein